MNEVPVKAVKAPTKAAAASKAKAAKSKAAASVVVPVAVEDREEVVEPVKENTRNNVASSSGASQKKLDQVSCKTQRAVP